MIKLRTILLSNYPFYIILFLVLIITLIKINIPYRSNFHNENKIIGIVTDIYTDGPYLQLKLKSLDNITCNYYFKNEQEKNNFNISLGDKIILTGKLENPKNNTIPNTFNYKKYLYYNYQYKTFKIESFKKVKNNKNIYYSLKNKIIKHINKYNSKSYLYTFILGNTSYLKNDIYNAMQGIGISHLVAISGMHISFLSMLILNLLKKMKVEENNRYYITSILLFIYLLLCFSPSVLRSFLFFFLLTINKINYFYIKTINIYLLTLSISLLINPFFIYNIGFLFSFIISFFLIISIDKLKNLSNFKQSLYVSIISFLSSFPICIYNFYQINIFSVIYNLFFVPLVSIIIFPLSLLTFIFPFLDKILCFILIFFEKIITILNSFNFSKIILMKPSIVIIIVYYVLIVLIIIKNKKRYILVFLILIFLHYNINIILNHNYVIMIDVGQGDSILLHSKNKNILIDTGGKNTYYSDFKRENNNNLSDNTINMLKSFGIRKIDLMVLTHGDNDHLGESINIINNYKVEKVLFNSNEFNYNEKNIIRILKQKHIKYDKCLQDNYYKFGDISIYSLNNNLLEENDSSIVLYVVINNLKFLFMGDATIKTEKNILNNYNLKDIDFIKVGHHGSDTSSSENFIRNINPRNCLISVGKDNKFGHPKENVLNVINNYCDIYRTDLNGSIEIKINKNNYKIKTYN